MLAIYICGGFALALIIWIVYTHNLVVRARTKVLEAYSGIDVQLKLRRDLVPNLVQTVSGYARHERTTLSLVTQARSRAVAAQTPEQMDIAAYPTGMELLSSGGTFVDSRGTSATGISVRPTGNFPLSIASKRIRAAACPISSVG